MLLFIATYLAILVIGYSSPPHPHIIHIVADDLGRNDLGFRNNYMTDSPNLNKLAQDGIILDDYYSFKICSPSRAATLSGRYPWGIGWYDMSSAEVNRCLAKNYTLIPGLLKQQGYRSHALGKWDVGFIAPECTASQAGFESFHGYYMACVADYWYHWRSGWVRCPFPIVNDTIPHDLGTDLSGNIGSNIQPWNSQGVNGTYDAHLFTQKAIDIIRNHDQSEPLYMYLAYQNTHVGCGSEYSMGVQAPCDTAKKYSKIVNDTWKLQAAMVAELDIGVGSVIQALQTNGLWNDTVIVFTSDNGGPLPHTRNYPLRGGKWTFWEGGVRLEAFVSGPKIPSHRRGTTFTDLIHSSDWYRTFLEGIAGGTMPHNTGPRPPDGYNVWDALMNDTPSPRDEVIHQVNSSFFNENVQSIRRGRYKLIRGNPGDSRAPKWPEKSNMDIPFGKSGGRQENGTNHCRGPMEPQKKGKFACAPPNFCLFDVVNDPSESENLGGNSKFSSIVDDLNRRLNEAGRTAYPTYVYFEQENVLNNAILQICGKMKETGFLEPLGV